ncbi:MAG: hypothetical protein ABSF09_04730 [Candidatus Bathyarchaeia archaeon]|jgi:hypothetical protein
MVHNNDGQFGTMHHVSYIANPTEEREPISSGTRMWMGARGSLARILNNALCTRRRLSGKTNRRNTGIEGNYNSKR